MVQFTGFLLFCLLSSASLAERGPEVFLQTFSIHSNEDTVDYSLNNNNFGFGVQQYWGNWGGAAFIFENSYDKTSFALAAGYGIERGGFDLAVHGIVANGYGRFLEEKTGDARNGIVAFPAYSIRYGMFRLVSTYPLGEFFDAPDVTTLQLVFEFDP